MREEKRNSQFYKLPPFLLPAHRSKSKKKKQNYRRTLEEEEKRGVTIGTDEPPSDPLSISSSTLSMSIQHLAG